MVLCQAVVRQRLASKRVAVLRYTRDLKAVVVIQTHLRRHIGVVLLSKCKKAALLIQTNFRKYMAMAEFLYQVSNVLLVQAVARQFLALKKTRTLIKRRNNRAASMIQKHIRRHQAMMFLSRQLLMVIQCQTTARRFLALKVSTTLMMENKAATTLVSQIWFRYIIFRCSLLTFVDLFLSITNVSPASTLP